MYFSSLRHSRLLISVKCGEWTYSLVLLLRTAELREVKQLYTHAANEAPTVVS